MEETLAASWAYVEALIARALTEDMAFDDVTTKALIPDTLEGRASIVVKDAGVLAGGEVARRVFLHVDSSLHIESLVDDGTRVKRGDVVAAVVGKVASILRAERTALNFLCHLSGVATETARYVEALEGLKTQVADTRKTAPGIRLLEKYAVHVGGGTSYRLHLGDGILIKDNHLAALRSQGIGLKEAIGIARQSSDLEVEAEVRSVQEALEALEAGADIILLDNMGMEDMRAVVSAADGRALIEASGCINLNNVRSVAETGVDIVSVGAITHSAEALDLSLDIEPAHGASHR
ncbi:MAG: carboxylating nicotinate-nucleotide diphosphorylase [Chloroflexota bacterium]|nr:carboxylating nicotinate-nucleotide diphosphorylase [Chloroflexota bacterium]